LTHERGAGYGRLSIKSSTFKEELCNRTLKLRRSRPGRAGPAIVSALGYPESLALGIGVLELVCIVLYLIPRTSVLGAILLTGYLGGAIASHVRIGSELFSILLPIIVGVMLWGGLFLRDDRLRTLLPLRS
jgi:hypothetical protein